MTSKRICFLCEPASANVFNAHKVKCIVFSYDNDGNVCYATSMFKRESRKDMFVKEKQKTLTEARFTESPKYISIQIKNIDKIEKQIISEIDKITEMSVLN